jgi:hypothetical protein
MYSNMSYCVMHPHDVLNSHTMLVSMSNGYVIRGLVPSAFQLGTREVVTGPDLCWLRFSIGRRLRMAHGLSHQFYSVQ